MVGGEPNLAGHGLSAVAGVTSDTCLCNVGFVFTVNGLRHLQHATRHHLGVFCVLGKIGRVVAINATPFIG